MEININSSNEKKIEYLEKDSLLFPSLLFGDEIRYTDVIAHFVRRFGRNPFIEGCPEIVKYDNIKNELSVNREKRYTDLWIGKIKRKGYGNSDSPNYELPEILIENKLKSIPYDDQLINYSKVFALKYLESFKEGKRQAKGEQIKITDETAKSLKAELEKLKFYILTPTDATKIKGAYQIEIPIGKSNKETKFLKFNNSWQNITYSSLGIYIKDFIENYKMAGDFEKAYWVDFSSILICFSALSSIISNIVEVKNDSIKKVFKPSEFFVRLKIEDLYSKYRASQCAELLSKTMKQQNIGQWTLKNIEEQDYYINHTFFRGAGLFEVVKGTGNGLIYIIQYQDGVLRKGIITTPSKAKKLKSWLLGDKEYEWFTEDKKTPLKFQIKSNDNRIGVDKMYHGFTVDKSKKLKFYYSFIKIRDCEEEEKETKNNIKPVELTVQDIVYLMSTYIKVNVPKL